jgi:hypothetical protein
MNTAEEPSIGSTESAVSAIRRSRAQAMTPEGQEYALFFYGLECYENGLNATLRNHGIRPRPCFIG